MKDYSKVIKYLENAKELMSGDKVDREHANVNILFAIQDLKQWEMQQDTETADLIKQAMETLNESR